MKKFLLFMFVMFFVCLDANATTTVVFGNTGRPAYRVTGAYRSTRPIHNFGSNAGFTPANIRRAQIRQRAINREKAMTRAMARQIASGYSGQQSTTTAQRPTQISRFNKNYKISAQKTSTRNGVIYYN